MAALSYIDNFPDGPVLPDNAVVHPRTLWRLGVGFSYIDQGANELVVIDPKAYWYCFTRDVALSSTFVVPCPTLEYAHELLELSLPLLPPGLNSS